jgi:hypothetical protein
LRNEVLLSVHGTRALVNGQPNAVHALLPLFSL